MLSRVADKNLTLQICVFLPGWRLALVLPLRNNCSDIMSRLLRLYRWRLRHCTSALHPLASCFTQIARGRLTIDLAMIEYLLEEARLLGEGLR